MSSRCPACHATGAAWNLGSLTIAHSGPCEYCKGEGRVSKKQADDWPDQMDRVLAERAQRSRKETAA